MNRKKTIKLSLISILFLLGLGGWFLHLRVHPIVKDEENFIPFVIGIISVLFLPFLFWFRKTITLAYIINGFFAIIGTIMMAHFSIIHFKVSVNIVNILLSTTFADILILWGKFVTGKAIFDLEFLKTDTDNLIKGRFLRYPNMGWWWIHLFALSIVYILGNTFWK